MRLPGLAVRRAAARRQRRERHGLGELTLALVVLNCSCAIRAWAPVAETLARAVSQARPPFSSVSGGSSAITFTPRASPGRPSAAWEAKRPTLWPWPIAIAITSSRMPPRGSAGSSTRPKLVSTASTSPRSTPSVFAVSWLSSAHDCQAIFVTGSGVSCSQDRFAPRPSWSSGEGTGSTR